MYNDCYQINFCIIICIEKNRGVFWRIVQTDECDNKMIIMLNLYWYKGKQVLRKYLESCSVFLVIHSIKF